MFVYLIGVLRHTKTYFLYTTAAIIKEKGHLAGTGEDIKNTVWGLVHVYGIVVWLTSQENQSHVKARFQTFATVLFSGS